MSELDEVIEMNVVVTDQAQEQPNFGVPLIASLHTNFADRVREYSQADDLLDDGFTTSSPEYEIASAMKNQDPTIQSFKLGRLTGTFTHTLHLIPTNVTIGYVYTLDAKVGANEFVTVTYTVVENDTVALICDELVTALAAVTDTAVTDAATHVALAADNAGELISLRVPQDGHLRVLDVTSVVTATLTADLAAIESEDPAWYGLTLALNTEDTIVTAATWCEGRTKVFFPQSMDWNVVDAGESTDVASLLLAGSYTRTCGIWKRGMGGLCWAGAAFLIQVLAPAPGEASPVHVSLATVPVDKLRTGERAALTAKNWTRYTNFGGFNRTFEGKTPSGRFIDVTRGIDWIKAMIQQDLSTYLYVNPKVPYTTSGLAGVRGVVENAIRRGLATGLVADDTAIVVNVPAIEDTDAADRANRIVRGVTFSFRLAGAAHRFVVSGTVTV